MEFETWNRDTLIKELQIAMKAAKFKPFNGFSGLLMAPEFPIDVQLRKKTDDELRGVYVQFKKQDEVFRQEYEENQEKKRFFNRPDCDADFSYWSKQAYWSIDEAITLLLGKEPRKVTWDEVKKFIPASFFANRFNEIRELARRYINCKEIHDPVFPGIFLAWAERMSFSIPAELKEAVNTLGIQVADWKGNYEKSAEQYNHLDKLYNETLELIKEKSQMIDILSLRLTNLEGGQQQVDADDLKETERQSLYKLIAAMAADGYGFNPSDKKSPIPKEISDAVTKWLGEKIDTDTARKWLKKASDRYPNLIVSKTE